MRTGSAAKLESLVRAHGGVLSAAEAAKAGLSRHAVQWALHTELLYPVRRGVYTTTTRWMRASPEVRHALEILGHQRINPQLIACETSAAIALALPTPSGPPAQPQLTVARTADQSKRGAPGGRGHRGGRLGRRSLLSAPEVLTLPSGIRATSPIRTVHDCARVWERPWGLAIADSALMKCGVEPGELLTAVRARGQVPGCQRALWVAEHARPKVESPLESLARGVVVLAGLPEPTPQVWIRTRDGSYRVDLLSGNVVIEADGQTKYSGPNDVWREKRREDALRDSGFEVVRFAFADYRRQHAWLAGYRRALTRAAARH